MLHLRRRHIFTTMNCDFLETEFFYKAQLSSTNDESLPNIVASIDISVNNQHPLNLMSEVSNSDTESSSHDEIPNPLPAPNYDETTTGHVESIQEEPIERYVLPPWENRGVPPKRYFPEKDSRNSKYPMENIAKARLTDDANAFVSSVYDEQIPTTVQQALTSKKWT